MGWCADGERYFFTIPKELNYLDSDSYYVYLKKSLKSCSISKLKVIKRGEFETQENKLLVEEIENLEVETKNFMSILAEKIDEKKLKLEQKNDKK